MPGLIFHGDRDRIVPAALGRELASVWGRDVGGNDAKARFVLAEGYGHNDLPLWGDGPFGGDLRAFLERLGLGSGAADEGVVAPEGGSPR